MKQRARRAALFGLALALGGNAGAEPVKYSLDPAHTFPMFEISHLGFSTHRGRFNRTRGSLVLDQATRQGELSVIVDAASIDTGQEALEKVLRGDGFFKVETHPELRFQSSRLEFDGERLVAVHGVLSMKGVDRPLSLKVDHFHCGRQLLQPRPICGANATGTLLRSEFNLDKYVGFGLGNEVRITIQVEAIADPDDPSPAS
jgi:polyisoprenoid-binding protein YceI